MQILIKIGSCLLEPNFFDYIVNLSVVNRCNRNNRSWYRVLLNRISCMVNIGDSMETLRTKNYWYWPHICVVIITSVKENM